jgi:hypothetical protein
VNDGARTHDNRNHNPGLYQLSYIHHRKVVHPTGIEPVTPPLEGECSIQLSYGYGKDFVMIYRMLLCLVCGRDGGIRTRDPLLPKQMRYQAALRPDWTET